MKNINKLMNNSCFLNNKFITKILYIIVSFLVLLKVFNLIEIINKKKFSITLADGDGYIPRFERFVENGAINEINEGTSILYNLTLRFLYIFVNNTYDTVLYLNVFCIIFLIVFGVYILYYFYKKHKIDFIYFIIPSFLYVFFVLQDRFLINILTNDDTFMGCIYLIMIFVFIKLMINPKTKYYLLIGMLLGLCFGIRELPILHIPALLFCIVFFVKDGYKAKITNISYLFLCLFLMIFILHSPSIFNGNGLSFVDKSPPNGVTWIQKNHLSIMKINETIGLYNMRPWSLWRATSFDEVKQYLIENGEDSLPRTFTKLVLNEPISLLKMSLYNIYFLFKSYFKVLGILIFLPFIFIRKNVYWVWFLLYTFAIAIVSYSIIELRWFAGVEILIFLSILYSFYLLKNKMLINLLLLISIVIIMLFDIKYLFLELL